MSGEHFRPALRQPALGARAWNGLDIGAGRWLVRSGFAEGVRRLRTASNDPETKRGHHEHDNGDPGATKDGSVESDRLDHRCLSRKIGARSSCYFDARNQKHIIRAMRHKRLFVSFVSSWSPFLCILALGTSLLVAQQPNATRNPLSASADVIAAGRVVFDQTCQSCHAPGGTGDRGPALNTGVFGHGSEDGDLFRTIREGLAGTQMPPFRGLADDQIWQIVVYLRTLSRASDERPGGERDAESRESSVRRVAVLRQGRLRQLSPGERTWRDRRARSLHGRARPGRRAPSEDSESRDTVRCACRREVEEVRSVAAVPRRGRSSSWRKQRTAARFAASAATKTRSRCRWWTRPARCICSTS